MAGIRIKRIYDEPHAEDGKRVLIDRLWPRGLTKDKAAVDVWMKELAPSHSLRQWFHQSPGGQFEEFKARYLSELADPEQQQRLDEIRAWARESTVTLLYGAKDETNNQAVVLKELLTE